MGKIKAVIFDLDGTIIDNNPFHRKAWTEFLKKYNISLDKFDYNQLFGKHNKEILSIVFDKKLNTEEARQLAYEKEAVYRKIYKTYIKPQKGLKDLLNKLKELDIKMGIATSAPAENLNFVLDELKIRNYFDVCADASKVKKSKPDPEIFLLVAKKLHAEPHECLVFEDSPSGIIGALNAGMKTIGINVVDPELAKDHCDLVIDHFGQFHSKINQYIVQS